MLDMPGSFCSMDCMNRYVMIMAGGAGERFWPLSRVAKPKHLWSVAGSGGCLLEQALRRAARVVPQDNIFIVTNREQVEGIRAACPDFPPDRIISEPLPRDTTAAVSAGAAWISLREAGRDASFAVLPSDHVVPDEDAFAATVLEAFELAEGGDRLVTIGVEPSFPSTGYGYIKRGEPLGGGDRPPCRVARFFEKPSAVRAAYYLESGGFYWNSGIFVWKVSSVVSAVSRFAPAIGAAFEQMRADAENGGDFAGAMARCYPDVERISIDFSVMEKADNAWVVPAGFAWDDVGSWSAVERHYARDENGNVARGELFAKDSEDCVVFDESGRATALVGVRDLIVVHAPDATLICRRDCAESVKGLVAMLPKKYR